MQKPYKFYCENLFSVSETDARCGVPFLNLKFHVDADPGDLKKLSGPGIYGLCFRSNAGEDDWKLVYLGKYRGPRNNPFSGNVAATRWWTHLASVTMRGHLVSVRKRTLISAMLKDTEIGVGLTKGFDCLRTDAGCQSSLNRTIFAHKNWHLFSPGSTIGAPNNLLEHFKFIYFQIQNIKSKRIDEKNISQIRSKISSAEKSLIRELSPPCNNLKQSVLWNCDYAFKKIEMVAEDLSLAIDSLS